tara:strand:+ start:955 stop:1716 length:762 start_codon:yes stop_codon:yes gene_type:complete
MNSKSNQKVVLITGASSGLGLSFAKYLLEQNYFVILAGRNIQKLKYIESNLNNGEKKTLAIKMDVRSKQSIEEAISRILIDCNNINVLINNAGISLEKYIIDFSEEDFDELMNTNLRGSWLVACSVAKNMIKNDCGGKILNISSVLASNVLPMLSLYSISKSALIQMTRSMALEWARYNIQVNALSPGYIETDINIDFFKTPAGKNKITKLLRKRIGLPEDLHSALSMFISKESNFITGSELIVDDGQSLKNL